MADQNIYMSFFEDSEENKHIFYGVKDSVVDIHYPSYCLTNNASYKFARVLFCTYLDGLSAETAVHIHEKFIVNLFNVTTAGSSLNTSIQVNLEAVALAEKVLSGSVNATCESLKVNSLGEKDTEHRVLITQEPYKDSDGNDRYGIGVWINIEGFDNIAIEPVYSMGYNHTPIHKDHFNAYYVTTYLCNNNKINDSNLVNIESQITAYQISSGVYNSDLATATLDNIQTTLAKIPGEYTQNTVYYSNTYVPEKVDKEELISPYSIRGTFTEKIVAIDSINKAIRVLKNGYYALQLRNGFFLAEGEESQLEMVVYKNTGSIKELGMQAYLEGGKKNTASSNVAIVHLTTSDAIYLDLIWSNVDITVDHETFMTIYPIKYD